MKVIKCALVSGMIITGAYIMYSKNECKTRKKILKTGKQFLKDIGIM